MPIASATLLMAKNASKLSVELMVCEDHRIIPATTNIIASVTLNFSTRCDTSAKIAITAAKAASSTSYIEKSPISLISNQRCKGGTARVSLRSFDPLRGVYIKYVDPFSTQIKALCTTSNVMLALVMVAR